MLKQPQYSPVTVEDQVAIIFACTKGFLDKVPENKVKDFEENYLSTLNASHRGTLDELKAGKLNDEGIATLEQLAKDLAKQYIDA
ncbi:MAG: F0F1 ATP synthase subunit alpha, partial [Flavobacteriales bacterium]|nr:F0F1 ATP synthase subunit alpha [Flavobacteriales bacterium]